MKRVLRAEALFFLIPIAVACVQMYLTSTTDLTRWRGGGFGMYSDPHPNQGRNVWLTGSREGQDVAVRLFPRDPRWDSSSAPPQQAIASLERAAMEFRDFPSLPRLEPMGARIAEFLDEHGHLPLVASLVPDRDLRIEVIEIAIGADWDSLKATRIAERTW